MTLHTIDTGFFKLDGGAMFGVVPKVLWNKLNPADEKNLCTWAMRSLLIEDGDRLILIDTGLGDKQNEKFFSYFEPHGEDDLISSIQKAGYSSNEVTDVILTHLHFDHCGGAVIRTGDNNYAAQFNNATYWSNKEHWGAAIHPNDREKASFLKENFQPLEANDQVSFLEDGEKLTDSITVKTVSGHTESMIIPHIKIGEQTLVYMADLLPSVHHLPMPYVMAYDVQPLLTLREKESFLNEALDQNYILFFQHDPMNEACTLKNTAKGIRAGDIGALKDFVG